MVKLDQIIHTIELPDGISYSMDGDTLTFSKDGSQISREFRHSRISVRASEDSIEVHCALPRRREKALSGTWAAHIRNMVRGIDIGFTYRTQGCVFPLPNDHQNRREPDVDYQSLRREGTTYCSSSMEP